MSTKQVHVWVTGRVQGVFFRAATRDQAQRLGLEGWVKNLRDGRVEALFAGPEDKVNQMLAWCRQGPPHAHVADLEIKWEEVSWNQEGFIIAY
jgi:acylphosphatase